MNIKVNTADELIHLAGKYEAISFDLFDTLITRRCLVPEDVFVIVGQYAERKYEIKDFAEARKKAVLENKIPNPDLRNIYDKLNRILQGQSEKETITKETILDLMQYEIQIEKNVLIRRESVVEALREIRKQGKKVYLLTDMYLDHNILKGILSDLGIHEQKEYDEMLISCECRSLKTENLFGIYKEKHSADSYLHIGDNSNSDISCAENYEIDTVKIDSPACMYEQSTYQHNVPLSGDYNLTERNLLGTFISIWFNNPFSQKKKDGSAILYAEEALGTLLAYLMLKDIRDITCKEQFDKILFSSRDGWLLQKIYEKTKIANEVDSIYFYTSRKSVNGLVFPDDHSILWLAHLGFSCPQSDILREAFDIEVNDQPKEQEFDQWILSYRKQILEKAEEKKENYLQYLQNNQLDNGRYLFFDLISTGTCQLRLRQVFGLDLTGYYLIKQKTNEPEREELLAYSLLQNTDNDAEDLFMQLHYLFELIFTSPESSLYAFNHLGEPLFRDESRTELEIRDLSIVQDRICENVAALFALSDYSTETSRETGNQKEIKSENLEKQILVNLLKTFIQNDLLSIGLENAVLMDDWMNTKHMIGEELKGQGFSAFYHYAPIREGLLNWMDYRPEARVLELGCEFGALTGLFLRRGCHVIAVDAEEESIETVSARYSSQIHEEKLKTLFCNWSELNENIKADELFDYIILMPSFYREHLEDCLKNAKCFLKENGILFIAAQNRIGIKAIAEDRSHDIPAWDISLTKKELEQNLRKAEIPYFRFYYPLPDYIIPQEICSEEFLSEAGRTDRILDYHPDYSLLIHDPETLKKDYAENGVSEVHMNSFLVICSKTTSDEYQRICSIQDIHLSTDRTNDRAFATKLYTDKAEKKALYPEGIRGISELLQNTRELSDRGLYTLPLTEWKRSKNTGSQAEMNNTADTLLMPFCKFPLLIDILKEHADDIEFLETIFRQLWRNILLSSDTASLDEHSTGSLHILKKAYIEMIPLNCFYDGENPIYFDQEFSMANCPAEYVMFRALRYTDLEFTNAGLQFPLEHFIREYGLTDYWETGLKREDEFIYNLRNYNLYKSFHEWSNLDKQRIIQNRKYLREREIIIEKAEGMNTELRADNSLLVDSEQAGNNLVLCFSKDFYTREEDGASSHFRWSKASDTAFEICNNGNEKFYGTLSFALIAANGEQTKALISIDGNAVRTTDIAAEPIEIPICIFPSERIRIQIETKCNPVQLTGDTRKLAFGLWNYQIEKKNKETQQSITLEAVTDESDQNNIGIILPSFKQNPPEHTLQDIDVQFSEEFYPIEEDGQDNAWHWAEKKDAFIAIENRNNQSFSGEFSFFLAPRISDSSGKIIIDEIDGSASPKSIRSRTAWIPNQIRIPIFLRPKERKIIRFELITGEENVSLKKHSGESNTDFRNLFFQILNYRIRNLKKSETGEKIESIRRIQLDMLSLLQHICDMHNLRYFAIYGTLLGAVRDGGYTPGDDDIDLALPREDYDKLREIICNDSTLPNRYEWIDPLTHQDVFYGGYAKLTDTSNRIKEYDYSSEISKTESKDIETRHHDFSRGVYIDLFPLDYCEENEESRTAHIRKIIKLQNTLLYKATGHLKGCNTDEEQEIKKYAESVSWKDAATQLEDQFRRIKSSSSNYMAILARRNNLRDMKTWDWRYFGNYETSFFEDTEIRIPIGYAEFLQLIYGTNYMEYPEKMME